MKNSITKLCATAALALGLTTTSCIGPNHAYNSLGSWNSTVSENKFLNELVFIGMHVVPAYPLCFAGDLIIFNSIEFWSGNNPIPTPGDFESQGKL